MKLSEVRDLKQGTEFHNRILIPIHSDKMQTCSRKSN